MKNWQNSDVGQTQINLTMKIVKTDISFFLNLIQFNPADLNFGATFFRKWCVSLYTFTGIHFDNT